MAVGSLRAAVVDGDSRKGCFLAGQISGMVNSEQTAKEIVEDMVSGAERVFEEASKWAK